LVLRQKVEVGRPRLRWHEYAQNDLRDIELNGGEKILEKNGHLSLKEIKILRGLESRDGSIRSGCVQV
jgi:hypothetical protein